MLYLVAVLIPPLAVLLCGKPFQALINLILWIPTIHIGAMVHAIFVVHNHYADRRNQEILRQIRRGQ